MLEEESLTVGTLPILKLDMQCFRLMKRITSEASSM